MRLRRIPETVTTGIVDRLDRYPKATACGRCWRYEGHSEECQAEQEARLVDWAEKRKDR